MRLSTFIITSMVLSIQQFADKYRQEDLNMTLKELELDRGLPRIKTYDFIIVGGGTAGCVLAGRLSEHFNVLLLESGGTPVPATYNPYLNRFVDAHPAINNFFDFTLANGNILPISVGRMLGGSWSHNGNLFNRGSPHDYNHYAELTGDESWSYENILQHFKTSEGFHGRLIDEDERPYLYSSTGSLYVETDWPPITEAWFQSGMELGYNVTDANGNQKEGFAPVVKSVRNGERVSTYTAFVKPFESKRHSLHVLRYSDVQNILIDKNQRAYGVAYFRHGIPQIAHASKEVIISCGTYSSPLLLMKSGVGPRATLEEAGIPLRMELPGVGQNLRNHPFVILRFTANNPDWTLLSRLQETDVEKELGTYHSHQSGGFYTLQQFSPQAFIVSSEAIANGECDWPDIQLLLQSHALIGEAERTLAVEIVVGRPTSVGEIGLNTSSFLEGERYDPNLALVDFRMLSEAHDVDVMIEGIKLGLRVIEETTAFQAMNVTYREDIPEPCIDLIPRSDEYWRCHIRERAGLVRHAAGTCKMGRNSDPLAVVDSKLRVRGIKNLRVVDASVMPQPTNTNIAAGVMVIAEKISRDILKEYKYF